MLWHDDGTEVGKRRPGSGWIPLASGRFGCWSGRTLPEMSNVLEFSTEMGWDGMGWDILTI